MLDFPSMMLGAYIAIGDPSPDPPMDEGDDDLDPPLYLEDTDTEYDAWRDDRLDRDREF